MVNLFATQPTFIERVSGDPLGFLLSCLIWIPIVIWVLSMVGWMIEGEIEPLFGLVAVFGSVGLGAVAASPPAPWVTPIIFGFVLCMVVFYPYMRHQMAQQQLTAFEMKQIEDAYRELSLRPDNAMAQMRMARVLERRGKLGHAIAIAETALHGRPIKMVEDEVREVRRWKVNATDASLFEDASCLRCGAKNPVGTLICVGCGGPFLLDIAQGRSVLKSPIVKRLIAGWLVALLVFIAIPVTATSGLPGAATGGLIAAEILIAIFVAVLAIKKEGPHPTR